MPSMTPIATLYTAIPICGALVALFTIEQMVNGWRNGFADRKAPQHEDGGSRCDHQRRAHRPDGLPVPVPRLHGRAGRLRADRLGAAGDDVHAGQRSLDDRAALQWHGRRGAAGGAVLPAGRRPDDVGQRYGSHDQAVADDGRTFARRAGAGRDPVQHVLCRHFRLFGRRRRRADPHAGAGNGPRRLRPGLHRRADRLGRDDGQPDPAQHHGGGLRRDRQRLDRRAVSRRRRAGRAGRHRADDLQPFLRPGRLQAQARDLRPVLHGGQGSRRAADDPDHHHGRHSHRPVHADRGRRHRGGLYRVRRDPAAQFPAPAQSAARHGDDRTALFHSADHHWRRLGVRLDAGLSARTGRGVGVDRAAPPAAIRS